MPLSKTLFLWLYFIFKKIIYICRDFMFHPTNLKHDFWLAVMAEWLRRLTRMRAPAKPRYQLGFPRVGSNPTHSEFLVFSNRCQRSSAKLVFVKK